MLKFIQDLISAISYLFIEMSPYLLLGFGIAGLLYIFIPRESIIKYLGKSGWKSILNGVLIGIPLPLCSCGVIPVAISLRKQGASKQATLSFLVSTPTTGVDSMLATYGLLGPLFAITRPIAAFFGGILTGGLAKIFIKDKDEKQNVENNSSCNVCDRDDEHKHSIGEKILTGIKYGFGEMIEDTGKWIILGVIIGGLIEVLLPTDFIHNYAGTTFKGILWMFAIGIPMYVCATGSIPIAASLIMKGMSPGAGLVFLIAGPATNTVTMGVIAKHLGKKALLIYLISLFITSIVFAYGFDYLWNLLGSDKALIMGMMSHKGNLLKNISAIILAILIIVPLIKKVIKKEDKMVENKKATNIFSVPSISCSHCEMTIKKALSNIDGVDNVTVDLKNKTVSYTGKASKEIVKKAIVDSGYDVVE